MGVILTTVAGLSIWIILWALGVKAFDGFMLAMVMVLVAATARIIAPFLPGNRE
jgi:hypothetical protein